LTTADFGGQPFGPQLIAHIVSTIVGGSPVTSTFTRLATNRDSVAFPIVSDVTGAAWVPELGEIPALNLSDSTDTVTVAKLAGLLTVSKEAFDDASFPVERQVERLLVDKFSAKLDSDLLNGSTPTPPAPTGILAGAASVSGTDLELAAINAMVAIETAGGHPDYIAMSPTTLGQVLSERDSQDRPLWRDAATSLAGLRTVLSPALTTPIVYDSSRIYLVIRDGFHVAMSDTADGAWDHYAISLRLVGRFACAVPDANSAIRTLTVA